MAFSVITLLAAPALADREDNWHWHDGIEAPTSFFPAILGQTLAVYLLDPAHCTDATDKALLGPTGITGNQVLTAGHCETTTKIIHLRVNPGNPAPSGWSPIPFRGNTLYYMLTDR